MVSGQYNNFINGKGGGSSVPSWWGSPDRGKVPLGWTISPALLQLGPAVLAYLVAVRLPRSPAVQVDFGRRPWQLTRASYSMGKHGAYCLVPPSTGPQPLYTLVLKYA